MSVLLVFKVAVASCCVPRGLLTGSYGSMGGMTARDAIACLLALQAALSGTRDVVETTLGR
jgi:hypothetical protein